MKAVLIFLMSEFRFTFTLHRGLKLMYVTYVWLVNAELYTDVLSFPYQICFILEIERNIAHSGAKVL